jgi:hypothetical protein
MMSDQPHIENNVIRIHTFHKLIDSIKERECAVRIKIIGEENKFGNDFLKVVWSGPAGILLQHEKDRSFKAIENMAKIHAFALNAPIMGFEAEKIYPLSVKFYAIPYK